jgi:hypothetical protein
MLYNDDGLLENETELEDAEVVANGDGDDENYIAKLLESDKDIEEDEDVIDTK